MRSGGFEIMLACMPGKYGLAIVQYVKPLP